jgi:geranylgeranyl pyrophosphate synthase
MSSASPKDKAKFLKYFGKKNVSLSEINLEISLLKKYGSVTHAVKLADFYLKCGLYYLQWLPDNQARTSLIKLSRFLTKRNW